MKLFNHKMKFLLIFFLLTFDVYSKASMKIKISKFSKNLLEKTTRNKYSFSKKTKSEKTVSAKSKNPALVATKVASYVIVVLMKIATIFMNYAITKIETMKLELRKEHRDFLSEKRHEIDTLIENNCLFYKFLKYSTSSHLHSLDFHLILVRSYQFGNSKKKEDIELKEKSISMINDLILLKEKVLFTLEEKTIDACSVEKIANNNIHRYNYKLAFFEVFFILLY